MGPQPSRTRNRCSLGGVDGTIEKANLFKSQVKKKTPVECGKQTQEISKALCSVIKNLKA